MDVNVALLRAVYISIVIRILSSREGSFFLSIGCRYRGGIIIFGVSVRGYEGRGIMCCEDYYVSKKVRCLYDPRFSCQSLGDSLRYRAHYQVSLSFIFGPSSQ